MKKITLVSVLALIVLLAGFSTVLAEVLTKGPLSGDPPTCPSGNWYGGTLDGWTKSTRHGMPTFEVSGENTLDEAILPKIMRITPADVDPKDNSESVEYLDPQDGTWHKFDKTGNDTWGKTQVYTQHIRVHHESFLFATCDMDTGAPPPTSTSTIVPPTATPTDIPPTATPTSTPTIVPPTSTPTSTPTQMPGTAYVEVQKIFDKDPEGKVFRVCIDANCQEVTGNTTLTWRNVGEGEHSLYEEADPSGIWQGLFENCMSSVGPASQANNPVIHFSVQAGQKVSLMCTLRNSKVSTALPIVGEPGSVSERIFLPAIQR